MLSICLSTSIDKNEKRKNKPRQNKAYGKKKNLIFISSYGMTTPDRTHFVVVISLRKSTPFNDAPLHSAPNCFPARALSLRQGAHWNISRLHFLPPLCFSLDI